jgi:hypothetical protein
VDTATVDNCWLIIMILKHPTVVSSLLLSQPLLQVVRLPWRHPDFGILLQLLLASIKQDVRLATCHDEKDAQQNVQCLSWCP